MILTGYTHHIGVPLPCAAIIAPEHAASGDPAELAAHCLEAVAPAFAEAVREGDILVVAAEVGAGASAEPAVLALQACGVAAVLCAAAHSPFTELAEVYGMPVLVCPEAANSIPTGALLRIDLTAGMIEERALDARWNCPPARQPLLEAAQRAQLLARMRRVVEEEGYAD
jgi:3-isopropylmalate/(R)-2-methylmalate dehydratase small subunit